MKKCMLTGSFDPFTKGHLDMLKRATKIFDKVYVAILVNPEKKQMFCVDDRIKIIRRAIEGMEGSIFVISYAGMTIDLARELQVDCLIRGIRSESDLDYEIDMSDYNLNEGGVDTVCFLSNNLSFISSTEVRRRIRENEDISGLVPDNTVDLIKRLYEEGVR
ncbi:MAG: pantetheine-phosphate adenylyltransferase [Clostridia bacterium]|nr:pantetheine-phosphate adenylyltransferase [Clostridia bacterium]